MLFDKSENIAVPAAARRANMTFNGFGKAVFPKCVIKAGGTVLAAFKNI